MQSLSGHLVFHQPTMTMSVSATKHIMQRRHLSSSSLSPPSNEVILAHSQSPTPNMSSNQSTQPPLEQQPCNATDTVMATEHQPMAAYAPTSPANYYDAQSHSAQMQHHLQQHHLHYNTDSAVQQPDPGPLDAAAYNLQAANSNVYGGNFQNPSVISESRTNRGYDAYSDVMHDENANVTSLYGQANADDSLLGNVDSYGGRAHNAMPPPMMAPMYDHDYRHAQQSIGHPYGQPHHMYHSGQQSSLQPQHPQQHLQSHHHHHQHHQHHQQQHRHHRHHQQEHAHHHSHHHRHRHEHRLAYAGQQSPSTSGAMLPQVSVANAPSTSSAAYYNNRPESCSSAASASPPPSSSMAGASILSSDPHNNMINMQQQNNSRESRNLAEKNRREKLNGCVQTLTLYVPHVRDSPRRVDKTGVLRFAAHGLRLQYVFGQSQRLHSVDDDMVSTLMRLMDSFLIVVNIRGQVVLVSSCIERQLGHCQNDMLGQNILNYAHPGDRPFVRQALIPDNLDTMFDAHNGAHANRHTSDTETDENSSSVGGRSSSSSGSAFISHDESIEEQLQQDRRRFTFRFARAGPRSEPTQYEFVRLEGCFRIADSSARASAQDAPYPTGLQLTRRARTRDDSLPSHINGNDIVFVATMHIIKPPSLRDRLREACRFEYKTRHLIDGRIVQCDQRISLVAGYMADEVCGLSPFTFMHKADVRWVMIALRQMYESCDVTGESCYRLISRTGRFIYLRTEGFMEVGKSNYISSFVCRNTLMPDDEGERLLAIMKEQYSMYVNELNAWSAPSPSASSLSDCASTGSSGLGSGGSTAALLQQPSPVSAMSPDSSDIALAADEDEINTMVIGIHSMVRGLPHSQIATGGDAQQQHHRRDLPSDEALAEIHMRRRDGREQFSYEMPQPQETMLSVQRALAVIQQNVHIMSSGDDSGADSGADNESPDAPFETAHGAPAPLADVASPTPSEDSTYANVKLTDSSMRQLLGTETRMSAEQKTENYSNLLSSSRLRQMHNNAPVSPAGSSASVASPPPAAQPPLPSRQPAGSNGSLGSPTAEALSPPSAIAAPAQRRVDALARAKLPSKTRGSPQLVAGRPRDFCSDVGGFRPEILVCADEHSLRNPRIRRRASSRRVDGMQQPVASKRALSDCCDDGGVVHKRPAIEVRTMADAADASARRTMLGHATGDEAIAAVPGTNGGYGAGALRSANETHCDGPRLRHTNSPANSMAGPAGFEFGDRMSDAGSDLQSPSSVGSLDQAHHFGDVIDSDFITGKDLLLSTMSSSNDMDASQSMIKEEFSVIYLPSGGTSGASNALGASDAAGARDSNTHAIPFDLDSSDNTDDLNDDICEVPS